MYEYRRMTSDQRRAVVEERRARGFPLHKPPHLRSGEGWYFISAATYEHRHRFTTSAELTALERRLLEACGEARIPCAGWVVMPSHYHLLVEVEKLAALGTSLGRVTAGRRDTRTPHTSRPARPVGWPPALVRGKVSWWVPSGR